MPRKIAEYLSVLVFLLVIATVFQQIATSLTEQGIASGGPYDNAASYPRSLAIIIAILLAGYLASLLFARKGSPAMEQSEGMEAEPLTAPSDMPVEPQDQGNGEEGEASIARGVLLLLFFSTYLVLLPYLGYQLSTPLMIGAVLLLAGLRNVLGVLFFSVAASLVVSFLFEVFLNVVLPGGVFSLNIPWPSL